MEFLTKTVVSSVCVSVSVSVSVCVCVCVCIQYVLCDAVVPHVLLTCMFSVDFSLVLL